MSLQLIDTTTSAGDSPQAGGNKINANYAGQWDEDRIMRCAVQEGTAWVAGQTLQLINASGGPGNIEAIQVAVLNGDAIDSTISMTIDGVALPAVEMGIFFLTYGSNISLTPPGHTWKSDDFASTLPQPYAGLFRRIFIPYNTSCVISITSATGANPATVYSQVQYRSGIIPLSKTGTRRKRFGYAAFPLGSTTVAQYGNIQLLNLTGRGQIEGIHLFMYGTAGAPYWLEGNPTFVFDGTTTAWGGCEDFFGTQGYGTSDGGAVSESWGIPLNGASGAQYFTGMFRLFPKDPPIFNASAQFSIYNGQSGEGSAPGTIHLAAFVSYYLDQ